MPSLISFNEDAPEDRRRIKVDEEPEQVAAALAGGGFPRFTNNGKAIWINASSVRMIRARTGAEESTEGEGADDE